MMRALRPLSFLFLTALAAAPLSAQDDLPDLKGTIDGSIRWLRSVQDPKSGSYGSGVETTAWVLLALAKSPRHYQVTDGPFVARGLDYVSAQQRSDGSFGELSESRVAVAALAALSTPASQDALTRGLAALGDAGVADPFAALYERVEGRPQILARCQALLRERTDSGSWEGEGGAVRTTAIRIVELSDYYAELKPPSEPGERKPLPAFDEADRAAVEAARERGVRFLLKLGPEGLFGAPDRPDAGLTAMAISALATWPAPRPDDVQRAIDGGITWLLTLQRDNGAIHDGKLASYNTSAAIMALAAVDAEAHAETIERARDFLLVLQADEGEGYSPDHHYYGGIGYGGDERPDLSNLQMALEALSVSGLDQDHEGFQNALKFLERCQNRSESNDLRLLDGDVVLVPGDDGGAAYMPGNSPAGYVELEDGTKVARSYGSMSYALLKGYIFAGLPKDDPRMQECYDWVRENYTLDVNPGFEALSDPRAAYQGLFYYFHTMARALELYGEDELIDGRGKAHAWRRELSGRLLAMQSPADGSWTNENAPRWWEGNPLLATAYALLTLDAALPR